MGMGLRCDFSQWRFELMGGWTLASKNDIRAKHISVADLCVTFFFSLIPPTPFHILVQCTIFFIFLITFCTYLWH